MDEKRQIWLDEFVNLKLAGAGLPLDGEAARVAYIRAYADSAEFAFYCLSRSIKQLGIVMAPMFTKAFEPLNRKRRR